jgi:putative transposase
VEDKPAVIERMVAEGKPLVDGKLTWDKRLGTYHFIYTYKLTGLVDPDPKFESKRIAAADPGVHPFQAWYSPTSGEHGRLLDGETATLEQRCLALDKLRSRLDKHRGGRTRRRRQRWRTRSRLRRRFARECLRLTEWVKGAHYDCAHQLLEKHDLIIQPVFETSRLARTEKRNIQSRTARAMLTWSHYKYHQRLKSAAVRYPGRHIIDAREPGTSKTCTGCGAWNAGLRVQDKLFVCPTCGIRVDRQLAGARNNFFAAYGAAVGMGWDGVGG